MPTSSNYVVSKGYEAGDALTKKRFVKFDDPGVVVLGTAGDAACGVAVFSVSSDEIDKGKLASVQTEGRAIVESGEPINVGQLVAVGTNGVAMVATSGDVVVGMCDEPSTDDPNDCSVSLSVHAGNVVPA